jgi:Xaa-Pro aminopeptidase
MMSVCRPGMQEFQLEAEFYNHAVQFGIENWAYSPIVAAGKDSAILHYNSKSLWSMFLI